MGPLSESLDRLGTPRVLVIGDLILDRYTWGDAERVSPEAPVLVVRADREEPRPGGAASVATLLRGLGAEVTLAGVVGDDRAADELCGLLSRQGVDARAVLREPGRITTSKERIVGRAAQRHPHQILRVDREVRAPLTRAEEERLGEAAVRELGRHEALLISDYGKGVCTSGLLARVVAAAAESEVPVLVDPARGADFGRYRGAALVAPNRAEAEQALGRPVRTPRDAAAAGNELVERFGLAAVLVKLDRDGMVLARAGNPPAEFPTRARDVYDVTGAGDMVLAVLGLGVASGLALDEAVRLANVAAGLEVERLGVAPVTREELRREVAGPAAGAGKRVGLDEMAALAEAYRRRGRTVVLANGCFDLLHVGHLACLEEAARLGDVLVVAVNGDAGVRRLKGPTRPVIPQEDRAALLAGLACVGHVLVFEGDTPHEVLRRVRPDVLVKGGDYRREGAVVGREVVEGYGGAVKVVGLARGVSTTAILASCTRRGPGARPAPVERSH